MLNAKQRRSGSGAIFDNHLSSIIDPTGMKFGEMRRCATYHLPTLYMSPFDDDGEDGNIRRVNAGDA